METYYSKTKCNQDEIEEGVYYFAEIYGEKKLITKRRFGDMDDQEWIIDEDEDRYFAEDIDFVLMPFEVPINITEVELIKLKV